MPVQIGANVHDFSNPMGLLSDCHRRIEMFLGALERVAKIIDRPLTDEASRALASALRYFRESAPKHNADEEESLFPRLRRARNSEAQDALAHLEQLEKDHSWADSVHAEVDRLGRQYLAESRLPPADAEKFRAAVGQLAAMYKEHIATEEQAIFPLADRLLSQTDRASMGREMAGRRNISPVAQLPR